MKKFLIIFGIFLFSFIVIACGVNDNNSLENEHKYSQESNDNNAKNKNEKYTVVKLTFYPETYIEHKEYKLRKINIKTIYGFQVISYDVDDEIVSYIMVDQSGNLILYDYNENPIRIESRFSVELL